MNLPLLFLCFLATVFLFFVPSHPRHIISCDFFHLLPYAFTVCITLISQSANVWNVRTIFVGWCFALPILACVCDMLPLRLSSATYRVAIIWSNHSAHRWNQWVLVFCAVAIYLFRSGHSSFLFLVSGRFCRKSAWPWHSCDSCEATHTHTHKINTKCHSTFIANLRWQSMGTCHIQT